MPFHVACDARSAVPASASPADPGDPRHAPRSEFVFAVYLPREVDDFPARVEALRRASYPDLKSWDPRATTPSRPSVEVDFPPIEEFAPVEAEDIRFFGRNLNEADARALPEVAQVGLLTFHVAPGQFRPLYSVALRFAYDVAVAVEGILWDEETREAFSAEVWRANRIATLADPIDVRDHITIHMYRDGELNRLVTLGMAKLDLPDLVVDQVAPHVSGRMGNVVNLAAQTLLERREQSIPGTIHLDIDSLKNAKARAFFEDNWLEGATGQADLALRFVAPEEGDADNRLIALTFGGSLEEQSIRHIELLDRLWGSHDEVVKVQHSNELLAESARARTALMSLKDHFQAGLAPNERLMVKGPFATPVGGQQWMWVDVVRWEVETIYGVLQNDPFEIPGLEAGAKVSLREDDIFDYIHYRPDGSQVGNTTANYLD